MSEQTTTNDYPNLSSGSWGRNLNPESAHVGAEKAGHTVLVKPLVSGPTTPKVEHQHDRRPARRPDN